MRKLLIACIIFCLSSISLAEQANFFRVGVLKTPNNRGVYNVATAIWKDLTHQLNLDSTYISFTSETQVFTALKNNKIDVIVGPVKAQPNRPDVLFLSSYINDDIGVFVPYEPIGVWQRIIPLLRLFGSTVVVILICLVILVGVLVWAAEHRHNPQFSNRPFKDIGDGLWFAIVSMTTVGYGDKSPITFLGRFFTTLWLILMLFMLSSITALITAEVTGAKLAKNHGVTMDSFRGQKVVYLKGDNESEKLAKYYRYRSIVVDSLGQAIQLIDNRKVVAGLLNRIDARYYLSRHKQDDVQMTNLVFSNGRYAFAVNGQDKRTTVLDQAMLLMEDTGVLTRIENKELGVDSEMVKRSMRG